jgi:D-alanyl-D-alanine dipeptidase
MGANGAGGTDGADAGIVLLSDERVAAVPVEESGEPLVDLRTVPELRVDTRQSDTDGSYAYVRSSLAQRLLTAQALLPDGIRLLIIEGFRPPELQSRYFAEYTARLTARHPGRTPEWIRRQASAYISPPEVAPHVSGGAVDLTLCTTDGAELDMGTQVNDSPVASGNACFTAAPGLSEPARHNRDLLVAALSAAGMVNYPTEWWHWSFGDRYWAAHTGQKHAVYGPHPGPGVIR